MLKWGLLLVPEVINFPAEEHDDGCPRDSVVNLQRRFSVTMLPRERLLDHCVHFGPVSIEFSQLEARKLGALPVMYLPQGTRESNALLDKLGYFLVYRLAEMQSFLERISALRNDLQGHRADEKVAIESRQRISRSVFEREDLENLIGMLTEGVEELDPCIGALQGLSSLFYPTDRFKHSVELVSDPMYYYYQREWRVISDVVVGGVEVNRQLTRKQREAILETSPEFFSKVIKLRHRETARIDACVLLTEVDGKPIKDAIAAIHVPEDWGQEATAMLKEFELQDAVKTMKMKRGVLI